MSSAEQIVENRPDHHFRTEIPNILSKINLTTGAIALYFYYKNTCGDSGSCWKSKGTIERETGLSSASIRKYREELATPRQILNGKSLIKVSLRCSDKKGSETTLVEIVDIWRENGDYFRKLKEDGGGAKFERGGGQNLSGGRSKFDPKEDPSYQDPLSKKGNAKEVPSSSQKKKPSPSKARLKPRCPEKQACFEWLMGLGITDENNVVNEDSMSFLAHKYDRKRLEDCYRHLMHKMRKKGFRITTSVISIFRHILDNEASPIDENTEKNREYAQKAKQQFNWSTLEIKEKYVKDSRFDGKDVSLNMHSDDFKMLLGQLYKTLKEMF